MKRAVILVDHGSRRAEANQVLERIGELVAARLPDRVVRIAHMELAEPSVSTAIGSVLEAGVEEIVVHPYFLAPGRHSTRDIPEQVREALGRRTDVHVRITEPLGVHARLVDVIVERLDAVG